MTTWCDEGLRPAKSGRLALEFFSRGGDRAGSAPEESAAIGAPLPEGIGYNHGNNTNLHNGIIVYNIPAQIRENIHYYIDMRCFCIYTEPVVMTIHDREGLP